MVPFFRIANAEYSPKDPTRASQTSDGRWHRLSQRVLYFSSSLPLSVLELYVNGISFGLIRNKHHFSSVDIDLSKNTLRVPEAFYADNWTVNREFTQSFGNDWYFRKEYLFLAVKSAVLPTEVNVIVNTAHPDFGSLNFSDPNPVPLDPRLA